MITWWTGAIMQAAKQINKCNWYCQRWITNFCFQIHGNVAGSFIKSFMLERAKASKLAKLKNGIVTKSTFWDALVFKYDILYYIRCFSLYAGLTNYLPYTLPETIFQPQMIVLVYFGMPIELLCVYLEI